ncbi:DUF11 domain-containing protein, partial [uncultured Methanobrevibacter sp.]|uniref:DUF11 domain-containing protein n=2 Tax=uncultured Methanobrevibacter sp. TaxID=253161 RepID=UPI0025E20325
SDATDIKVWDILPAGVKYISGADSYNEATRNATWTIAKIEAGKSASVVLVINVIQAGKLNNTVFTNSYENKTIVNKTSDNITVIPNVILSLTEVTNVTEAVVGESIKYTITIHNSGLSDATDIKVWNILPAGVKYVSGADTYNETTRNATWTIDKIETGKSARFVLVIKVIQAGKLNNTFFANSSENKTVVNRTSDNITVIPNVVLSVDKSVDVSYVVVGDLVKYIIIVHNDGLSDATDVKVWDVLPVGVMYVSGADAYDEATHNATWTIAKIEAGKSASVVLVVNETHEGNMINSVFAHYRGNDSAFAYCCENTTVVNGTCGVVIIWNLEYSGLTDANDQFKLSAVDFAFGQSNSISHRKNNNPSNETFNFIVK